jgi:hypothetical protein
MRKQAFTLKIGDNVAAVHDTVYIPDDDSNHIQKIQRYYFSLLSPCTIEKVDLPEIKEIYLLSPSYTIWLAPDGCYENIDPRRTVRDTVLLEKMYIHKLGIGTFTEPLAHIIDYTLQDIERSVVTFVPTGSTYHVACERQQTLYKDLEVYDKNVSAKQLVKGAIYVEGGSYIMYMGRCSNGYICKRISAHNFDINDRDKFFQRHNYELSKMVDERYDFNCYEIKSKIKSNLRLCTLFTPEEATEIINKALKDTFSGLPSQLSEIKALMEKDEAARQFWLSQDSSRKSYQWDYTPESKDARERRNEHYKLERTYHTINDMSAIR